MSIPVSRPVGLLALTAFFLLLFGLPVLTAMGHSQAVALFNAFYRSGALVFGGGHVVLPLLREVTVTPSRPTTAAFTPGIIACARARRRKASQNGDVPMSTKTPGRKIAIRLTTAPAIPCGDGFMTAPRYAEKVKSGPGTACAAP